MRVRPLGGEARPGPRSPPSAAHRTG
jgi:hypothetical protein